MAQRFLYLLRHGQYARNGSLPGDSDGRLTMLGREQVALAAGRLAGLPITTIHHSTMRRAVETTEAVAARFPRVTLQPSTLLRECIPFVPTGYESMFARFSADVLARDNAQAAAACAEFLREPPDGSGDRHELVVSHGNLIRHLVCHALGAPPGAWIRAEIELCGLSEIVIGGPRGTIVVRHNDVGHLPAALRLYL